MEAPRPTPEDRLAERLEAGPSGWPETLARALRELGDVDRALYRALAGTPTPTLDAPVRRLSQSANGSKLWLSIASALFVAGGHQGRRAAITGLAAIGATSAIVNVPMKLAGRRVRPDRTAAQVPPERWVNMPTSNSFPSGHSASAAAFANAVGDVLPQLGAPLRLLASGVGFSRVHTGVHFPSDVLVGTIIGGTLGEIVAWAGRRFPWSRATGHRR